MDMVMLDLTFMKQGKDTGTDVYYLKGKVI